MRQITTALFKIEAALSENYDAKKTTSTERTERVIKVCVKAGMNPTITETSPYAFGNFSNLTLYNYLCPFNLLNRFKCYNTA